MGDRVIVRQNSNFEIESLALDLHDHDATDKKHPTPVPPRR